MSDNTYLGTYRALVANNNDPEDGARVTLLIPQVLGTAESHWAIPSTPTKTIPQPGDLVWVTFDGGDINAPVYVAVGLLELDAKIDDVAANAPVAGPVPKPPVNLALATQASFTSAGIDSADVTVTWDAVAQNQDGTDLTNLAGYVVQYSLDNKTWVGAGTIADTTTALHGLPLGVTVYVRVQTLNTDGQTSVWAVQSRLTASSTSKPPTLARPTANGVLGGIRVAWTGKDVTGADMPTSFDYARLQRSAGADTTFTNPTVVATFRSADTYYDSGVGYASSYNYRLVAVSKTNVPGDPSDYANATAVTAGTADLGVNSVTANAVKTGSLDAQYGVITAIDASVIKVNTYDLTTGSPIKTSANSARVELTAAGLKAYSNASTTIPTVAINSDGSASFTGTVNITGGSVPGSVVGGTIPGTTSISGDSIYTGTIDASKGISVKTSTNAARVELTSAGLKAYSSANSTMPTVAINSDGSATFTGKITATSGSSIDGAGVTGVVPNANVANTAGSAGTVTGSIGGTVVVPLGQVAGTTWPTGVVVPADNVAGKFNKATTTIDGGSIITGTVTAAAMTIGDFTNLIPNAGLNTVDATTTKPMGWTAASGCTISVVTAASGAKGLRMDKTAAAGTGGSDALPEWVDVVPGEYIAISYTTEGSWTTNYNAWIHVQKKTAAGVISSINPGNTGTTVPGSFLFVYQVPTDASQMRFYPTMSSSAAAGSYAIFSNMFARRMASGSLIVDGSITTPKILAGAVTANSIAIGDFTNLINNAAMTYQLQSWTGAINCTTSVVTAASGLLGLRMDKTGTSEADVFNDWFDVTPGETLNLSYTTEGSWSSGNAAVYMIQKNAAGVTSNLSPHGNGAGLNVPGDHSFSFVIPAGAVQVRARPYISSGASIGSYAIFSQMSLRRPPALSVGARGAFADPMDDLTQWQYLTGASTDWSVVTPTDASSANTAVVGNRVMRTATGKAVSEVIARKNPIPFDPTALYKVTVRVRKTTTVDTTKELFYLGLAGLANDVGMADTGQVWVNNTGAPSTGSQHYAVNGVQVPMGTTWTTFTGYWKGTAATGFGSTDPTAPGKMHTNVRYVTPIIYVNYSGGSAQWEIDSVVLERTAPTTITGDMLVDGAIDGKTITGAIIKTGSSGDYWQISSPTLGNGKVNQIQAFTTVGSIPGAITAYSKTNKDVGTAADSSQLILQAPQIASTNGQSPYIELNSESRDGVFGANIGYYANPNPATMTGSSHYFDAYVYADYGVSVGYGDVTLGDHDRNNSRILWHQAKASAMNISGQYDSFEIRRYLYDGGATRGTATVLWNATDSKYEIARYQLSPNDGLQVKMTAAGGATRGVVTNTGATSRKVHFDDYSPVTASTGLATVTHNATFTPNFVQVTHRWASGSPNLNVRYVNGSASATSFQIYACVANTGAAYAGGVGISAIMGV